MNPTLLRRTAPLALLAATAFGCALVKSDAGGEPNDGQARKDDKVTPAMAMLPVQEVPGSPPARTIAPKRSVLTMAVVTRPLDDALITEQVWQTVDDQSLSAESRRVLEANGLRAGVLTGTLPTDIQQLFKEDTPPDQRVTPTTISLPDGSHTMVAMGPPKASASLLLSHGSTASGREYADATGLFRLTVDHEGAQGLRLKFVPEVHHGQVQQRYSQVPNANAFEPQEFLSKPGQVEDVFRDLTASLVLQPGQVAVLGGRTDRDSSLGAFMFTQAKPNSDNLMRSVVLVWGEQSSADAFGRAPFDPAQLASGQSNSPQDDESSGFSLLRSLKRGRGKGDGEMPSKPAEPLKPFKESKPRAD